MGWPLLYKTPLGGLYGKVKRCRGLNFEMAFAAREWSNLRLKFYLSTDVEGVVSGRALVKSFGGG